MRKTDMLIGKAVGGPLARVKLTAGLSWDGRVRLRTKPFSSVIEYHPGFYSWDILLCTWVWTNAKGGYLNPNAIKNAARIQ